MQAKIPKTLVCKDSRDFAAIQHPFSPDSGAQTSGNE
jgi:hypothetical protein